MKSMKQLIGLALVAGVLFAGCGGSDSGNASQEASSQKETSELTDFQIEHGIGPVTEPVELGEELNEKLINKGEKIFELKCSACHKLNSRYVGPPLRGITHTRTPAYLMNMMLNPTEMIQKHPIPKALLGEYATRMTDQNLSREEARAVVEYLASKDRKK